MPMPTPTHSPHTPPRPSQKVIVIISVIVVSLLIVGLTQLMIARQLNSARDDIGRSVYFVVEADESVDSVSERLQDVGLIRSPGFFRLWLRLRGDADQIIAGRYRLDTSMSTSTIINTLTSENAALAQEVLVRFQEGWRTEEYAEALVNAGVLESVDDFLAATRDGRWNATYTFLHSRPSTVALEGYLFPDSYNIRMDDTPEEIIDRLLTTFGERMPTDMQARASALGLTVHQVMTIASIIEREAVLPQERPLIAAVYLNRMAIPMPLQADPTVQYQLGELGDWWPVIDGSDLQIDGRYNTYLNPSLPPGPICNPSTASIEAVLSPATTDFLFFVAKGDGSHAFAVTGEEHQRNVEQYINGGE